MPTVPMLQLYLDADSFSTYMPFLVVATITTYAFLLLSIKSFHGVFRAPFRLIKRNSKNAVKNQKTLEVGTKQENVSRESVEWNELVSRVHYFEKRNIELESNLLALQNELNGLLERLKKLDSEKEQLESAQIVNLEKIKNLKDSHDQLGTEIEALRIERSKLSAERDELYVKLQQQKEQRNKKLMDVSSIQEAARSLQLGGGKMYGTSSIQANEMSSDSEKALHAQAISEMGNLGLISDLAEISWAEKNRKEIEEKNLKIESQAKEIQKLKDFLKFCRAQIVQIQQNLNSNSKTQQSA